MCPAPGGQASAYDQIYLAKFIHDNWSSFEGKFDGLIDLNYNFLSMDLSAVPSDLFSQFPSGGWPVIGIMLMPLISAALQFLMTRISMKTNGNSNMNGSSKAMLYMMPLMTVWMGYILPRRPVRLLDRQRRLLLHSGAGAEQALL